MEEKLKAMMDRYLDTLITNDPSGLPVSDNLKVTENGYPIELGQGLFEIASEFTYRQYLIDSSANQVAIFGVVKETLLLANVMIRLKVIDDRITEIETIIARQGESSIARPDKMKEPKPIYDQILEESEKTSREEMIAAAHSYFEGIEKNTADVPFHPECNRTANGQQTTNTGPNPLSCLGQFEYKIFSYITKVRNRRYLMINEEKGLVFCIVMMDVPGRKENFDSFPIPFDKLPVYMYTPHTIFLAELFKIVKGQIREIEALITNIPLGATSGWPDQPE